MKHAFFLAPVGTSAGLTTVSLGLVNALDRRGVRVAFFKPISQLTDGVSGLERSTHFIRSTTTLQPADPIPVATATKMISEGRLDELLGQVIAAFHDSTAPADVVVIEGLRSARGDPHLGSLNQELAKTLNAEVILVASDADKATDQLDDQIAVLGTMILALGEVDGLVSGAVHSSVKTKPNAYSVSSLFFMCLPEKVLVYGDCDVVPDPDVETLADIAIQSADSAKAFGIPPRVAMISYSTGESGSGTDVDKVRAATKLAQSKRPDLLIDGPLQYD